jgi:DNA-binding CsgD family transcriptional regulator/tetratricopeptide (TPR) repeat protein
LAGALLRASTVRQLELRAVATACASALAELALRRPVVVAVDDVHWLDPASDRVLAFLARRLPENVGLLLATRQNEGSRVVSDLATDLVERLALAPLSLAAVHHLVVERTGAPLTRRRLTRLAAAGGGNPLFTVELARSVDVWPDGLSADEPLPVPPTLQALVSARIDGLSAWAREAVLVAAALSRPSAAVVNGALGVSLGAGGLDEAEQAGVIAFESGRIRFTHPLLAAAVYAASSPAARRALHQRLAEVVDDVEERARHLAAGAATPDEDVADELERAAARAAHRGAQAAAADLYAAAVRLTPSRHRGRLARRILGQAAALNAVGDFEDASELARRALDATDEVGPRTDALGLLASIEWFNGAAQTAAGHAEDALTLVGGDRVREGALHAQLVRLCFSWDLPSALAHADRATELIGEDGDPDTLARVLVDRLFGDALSGRSASEELLERALELEARSLAAGGRPQPMPLLWFHCTDQVTAARARFAFEERWFRDRGEDVWLADRLSHVAMAELHVGDWESAERHVEESCSLVEHLMLGGPRAMVYEKRALVDAHRGRTTRARTAVQKLLTDFERRQQSWWTTLTLSTSAFVEFVDGDYAAADRALLRMHERAAASGAVDVLFDRSEPFHIEALLELGEAERASQVLARLEDRGRRLPRPWIAASLPRARALLAAADRGPDVALEQLGDVHEDGASLLPFERGWTLLVKGRIERRAKRKRAAVDSLTAAADLFQRLGAPDFYARAQRELSRVGLRQSGTDLSHTELLVARYAAGGMTNREVAQAAFISTKTVEANLTKVYRKLGVRNRAELASRLRDDQGYGVRQT